MKHWHKLLILFIALSFSFAERTLAQGKTSDPLVRYVKTDGTYGADGSSWEDAKKNLQDAINDLRDYMQRYDIKEGGRIYVAQGKYTPTESTEETGGGVLYTAFKFYAGISVYGGYAGTETGDALNPENRVMTNDATHPWELKYITKLSGNHNTEKEVDFTWNETTKRFVTTHPACSYHVVWFATNGFTNGRANALPVAADASDSYKAVVDGFTIEGGDAKERDITTRKHTSYGGGAYMVKGAVLQNCVVQKNEATLRGGGVYMDGGGEISECHIHTNQVLGIGIIQGYGGGVCVDDKGSVKHSIIQNNVARMGGGLALTEENADTDDEYKDIAAAGCLVANNTSSAEAAGVFLLQGGLLNHMTIVRNDCTGPDVIVDGRRMGRSGGLYMTKSGFVTNSVIWGNQCNANSGIQFAAYTVKTANLQPTVSYTAVGNGDVTDWTGVKKQNVMSLGNDKNVGEGKKYPDFLDKSMTSTAGIDKVPYGAGLDNDNISATLDRWHPAGTSPLREAGVQISNYLSYDKNNVSNITEDMMGKAFMQVTTLGAYTPEAVTYVPAMLPSEEDPLEGDILTFFVDPAAKNLDRTNEPNLGSSWEASLAFVNDVAHWYENNVGKSITYWDGATSQQMQLTATTPIQIYVKEGEIHPIGYSKTANMRSSYIKMIDDFRLYGSVPKANTGTTVSGRDIKNHTTTLTANVTNNGYSYNSCHILVYSKASRTILDGFRIAYANAQPAGSFNPVFKNGGGIIIDSKMFGQGAMTDNKVRNCIIANNTAEQGAALYIRSECAYSEVDFTFENCIFHNNTSLDATATSAVHVENTAEGSGINVTFNHCNFLKNVGYGLYLKGQNTNVTLNNCFVWANASEAMNNSALLAEAGNAGKVRAIAVVDGATLSGSNNLLDAGVALNGLSNSHNILTYVNNTDAGYTYPISVNPTKNIGHSESGDLTYYGGAVDYTPRNMSPLVNAATADGIDETDLFGNIRHYGGLPDVGALENTALPASGKVLYVRDYRTATGDIDLTRGGDGLSWATAINGNAVYDLENREKLSVATLNIYGERYENNGTYQETFAPYSFMDGSTNKNNKSDDATVSDFKVKNYRYTSGLQYAVNLARLMTIDNATQDAVKVTVEVGAPSDKHQRLVPQDHHKVQVWVAAGEYNDGKGFKMQDGIDVFGGFPNLDNASPGLNERNPVTYATTIQVLAPTCAPGAINADTYKNILQPYSDFYYNPDASLNVATQGWSTMESVSDELLENLNSDGYSLTQEDVAAGYIKYYELDLNMQAGRNKVSIDDLANFNVLGVRLIGRDGTVVSTDFHHAKNMPAVTISDLQNLTDDMECIVKTETRGGWSVGYEENILKFRSTRDNGYGINVEPINDQNVFQFKKIDDNYYLYSYYAQQYVKSDRSMSDEASESITFHKQGDGTFVLQFTDNSNGYINLGGSHQMTVNWWSEADAGNKVTIMDCTDLRKAYYVLNAPSADKYTVQFIVETRTQAVTNATNVVLGNTVFTHKGTNKSAYDWYRVLTQPRNIDGSANEGAYGGYGKVQRGVNYNGPDYYNDEVIDSSDDHIHGGDKPINDWAIPTNARALNDSTTFRHKTSWNGFILQGGFMGSNQGNEGGAGALIRYNGKLENCVIQFNLGNATYGGGLMVRKGEIINTAIRYNYCSGSGGGLSATKFAILYNCEIYDNDSGSKDGSQVFLNQSLFYNNTITITGDPKHPVSKNKYIIAYSNALWFQYTVIANNVISSVDANGNEYLLFEMPFKDLDTYNIVFAYNNYYEGKDASQYGGDYMNWMRSNFNFVEAPQFKNQLAADFHLLSNSPCRNVAYEISTYKYKGKDYPVDFPTFDKDYTERIKDCRLDVGAHEYNGAYSITPTIGDLPPVVDPDDDPDNVNITVDNSGNTVDAGESLTQKFNAAHTMAVAADAVATPTVAVYYVTMTGAGLASAENPENAACRSKLQKVLDAAGRYKYLHPDEQVIVKLATISATQGYAPSRSSVNNSNDLDQSNPRTYTLLVPRGVEVWGGYDDDFNEADRDVINKKTILTGGYTNDGQNVNCYHVVTFTDDLFDAEGRLITLDNLPEGDGWTGLATTPTLKDKSGEMGNFNRAVLDGLFIEEGDASGEDKSGEAGKEFRYGGAAIVTNFAHVRNCVLMNNNASLGGGALYLEEGALVSGCVFEANSAENGGAIYVKENNDGGVVVNDAVNDYTNNFAHLYSCTIVRNEAADAGGGVWFHDNLRAVNTVVWQNTGNNGTNISGLTDPFITTEASQNAWDYPFAYSAVENILVPGVSNIAVSTEDEKGVRFDNTDAYYPLKRHSVLARAGYAAPLYKNRVGLFPTLETVDMAGNSRISYNRDEAGNAITAVEKDYMEIGARAYNAPLEVIPTADNLMTRLFVVKADSVNHEIYDVMAHATDDSGKPYLEGSSFAFPMQRLDDALQYIRKARNLPGKNNQTFEIFMTKGTYTPVRNIQSNTGALRNNTFLVPEGVSIYGGFLPKNASGKYYGPLNDNKVIGEILLDGTATGEVIAARERADLNQNSVLEPWEMKNQTILSGKCLNAEKAENVFHVVTCMADHNLVGTLPTERLPIVLSGLQITGGYALHGEDQNIGNVQSFYKGGGVMVDGSWGVTAENKRHIILVVHECDFSNNRAGDGGAIYSNGVVEVYASSFTQNAAKFCVHSAVAGEHGHGHGGAIFSDYSLTVVNSIFENNEAGAIEDAEDATNTAELSKGGAIYHNGDRGMVMLNSNVVRNQAVSYPALYVKTPNAGGDEAANNPHKIINSVFWGNEFREGAPVATVGDTETAKDFVVNYRLVGSETQVSSATDFEPWLMTDDEPTVAEMLWNCAYESGRGCDAVPMPNFRGVTYDYTKSIPANFADNLGSTPEKFKWANNNIIINADNEAVDGPNFVSPAHRSGIANYMPSADWTISRRNSLVDNGWTKVALNAGSFSNKTATGATGVYAEVRELVQDPATYNYSFTAYPLFDEVYMTYDKPSMGAENKMYRVAIDPNVSLGETYIDIGAYEFYHTKLNPTPEGSKDIIWVAENSKGEADGSSWANATSDLQRAIETLLSSRNNHDKEIRIIKGKYAPMYTIAGRLSFTVNTQAQNEVAIFPAGESKYAHMGVNSLTFIGGYSDEYASDNPDAQAYPTIMRMDEYDGLDASVFHIVDARNWYNQKTYARPYIEDYGHVDHLKQRVVPLTFDGLTFMNPYGDKVDVGAAIQYDAQCEYDVTGYDNPPTLIGSTLGDTVPKLTISRSKFVLNGAEKDAAGNSIKVPAVNIGEGGGYALVYNTVFHSNRGHALVAANTRVVNATFALNGGGVTLSVPQTSGASGVDIRSRIHNSLFWLNEGTFTVGAASGGEELFTNNSYVALGDAEPINGNETLIRDNADLVYGPNFKAPNLDATTEAEFLARDFSLMPSAKTIDKGSNSLYMQWVYNNNDVNATVADTEVDVAYKKRRIGNSVDRGAYEYQNTIQRCIYVDVTQSEAGAGLSWENPYNSLQDAVDLAAVYSAANSKPGYVFCKGGQTDERITMRENVKVYGSVAANFNENLTNVNDLDENVIDKYVIGLLGDRYGVASPVGSPTTIRGIQTTADYATPALMDGFVVTPKNGAAVQAPVVDLHATGAVVRNVVVHGVNNTSTEEGAGDKSAVRNTGGLLYNVLVRDCSTPAVYMASNGRALHCTFVGDVEVGEGGKVYNSMIKDQDGVTATEDKFVDCNLAGEFATYLDKQTNRNLWYQLEEQSAGIEEQSADIDVCGASLTDPCVDDLKTVLGGIADLSPYVNVATDRDLLGNPRLLSEGLDRGCYETWNVKSGALEATYNATTGMRFPQEGSVVYVHEGASLVMNKADFDLAGSGKGSRLVMRPGYMLLKDGASFYGQGAAVMLYQVAVERQIGNGDENYGALVALPYDFNYADVRKVTYTGDGVNLSEVASPTWQYYDGAARAASGYAAVEDNSACWKDVTDAVMPRHAGRYFKPAVSGVYRFVAASADEAVYTEGFAGTELETQKYVTLTQYDNRDSAPNFTTAENMGWNLVGAPYLVANYDGGLKEAGKAYSSADYNMSLPRMIYTLTADTPDAGDFNSASSVNALGLSPGAAFFTQTAVKSGETEELVFQLPKYKDPVASVSKRTLVLTDEDGHTDEVEINPATDGTAGSMVYTYGRDAVKWMAMNDALPQAYVLNDSVAGTRFSILGDAPVATEIPLGVKAGNNGRLTFALSATEAYETFTNVWLTDRVTGVVTNLKQNSYTADVEAGTETASRFTVKFGGNRPEMKDDLTAQRYEVSGKNGVLHINGLMGGETITVYDASGRLMHKATTSQQRYSVALSTGVYVVRIDNEVHKVTVE